MTNKKIVYQGKTKKGNNILIRHPKESDLSEMRNYINELSQERTFIRFQGEQISFREEKKFLKDRLKKITQKQSVQLLAFINDKLIGIADIGMLDKTERHLGVFGLTVAKKFRGEGIGKLLMTLILKEAKNIPQLEIITLGVFSKNQLARTIYKNFGFSEYGMLPRGVKLADGYDDHFEMYLDVKKN